MTSFKVTNGEVPRDALSLADSRSIPISCVTDPPTSPLPKIEFWLMTVLEAPDVTRMPAPTLAEIMFLLTVLLLPKIRIPGSIRPAPLPVPFPVMVLLVKVFEPELCEVSTPGPTEAAKRFPVTVAAEPVPMLRPPRPGLLMPLFLTSLF